MMARLALSALAACAALACAAHVDVVHQAGLPDSEKRPGLTREKYSGTFDGCKLWLDYTLEGGDVVWRKWGDYF